MEQEYKAAWDVKLFNFDIKSAKERRSIQIHELEEIRHLTYESTKIYKEKIKAYHDKRIISRSFEPNDRVLLFNSRLKLVGVKNGYDEVNIQNILRRKRKPSSTNTFSK